jgi:Flp pilus assembly protein TadG
VIAGLLRDRRCVAALEFGLLAPTFVMGFAGVVDLGNALYTWSKLEQALALGANYAIMNKAKVNVTSGSTVYQLADNIATIVATSNPGTAASSTVVVNDGPTSTVANGGTPSHSGTTANASSYYCLTGAPTSWTWGTAYANNATACADGSQPGQFVTITVSYSFTPFFASYGFVTNGQMTDGAAVQAN